MRSPDQFPRTGQTIFTVLLAADESQRHHEKVHL
jgi:hypothetical protein